MELNEKSPAGWSGTVASMKKHPEISNPFALAWYEKKKGYKPHYKPEEKGKEPEKKAKYKNEHLTFEQYVQSRDSN